ncbi:hypothetical protein, partial [Sphingobium yanoikuyae]|uniref:hypothetical protein n=2 Tax=Sphingobium TaxID=165695 RepID=UPI003F0D21F7
MTKMRYDRRRPPKSVPSDYPFEHGQHRRPTKKASKKPQQPALKCPRRRSGIKQTSIETLNRWTAEKREINNWKANIAAKNAAIAANVAPPTNLE